MRGIALSCNENVRHEEAKSELIAKRMNEVNKINKLNRAIKEMNDRSKGKPFKEVMKRIVSGK